VSLGALRSSLKPLIGRPVAVKSSRALRRRPVNSGAAASGWPPEAVFAVKLAQLDWWNMAQIMAGAELSIARLLAEPCAGARAPAEPQKSQKNSDPIGLARPKTLPTRPAPRY
jgi:hypothetical protein